MATSYAAYVARVAACQQQSGAIGELDPKAHQREKAALEDAIARFLSYCDGTARPLAIGRTPSPLTHATSSEQPMLAVGTAAAAMASAEAPRVADPAASRLNAEAAPAQPLGHQKWTHAAAAGTPAAGTFFKPQTAAPSASGSQARARVAEAAAARSPAPPLRPAGGGGGSHSVSKASGASRKHPREPDAGASKVASKKPRPDGADEDFM